jgi:polyisoprenyl-phosphate glycosyltransferase
MPANSSPCLAQASSEAELSRRKLISVSMSAYNEEGNVEEIYRQIVAEFEKLPQYDFEILFLDNASKDHTADRLRELAARDKRVKVILNARNFGHIRSPMHGILQARGDAVISMVSDLQEPPALIPQFLAKWEEGYRVVLGIKEQTEESALMAFVRGFYYELVCKLADTELNRNSTGFGLFDRRTVEILRELDDPYPYFRGQISEIGFPSAKILFKKPARKRGITSNNFYTLYDMAMLGITSHSKVPLRLATMIGFVMSFISFLISMGYLVAKLTFWNTFSLGLAPLIIGMFFFSSVQLFFIGILGEYMGAIHTHIMKRPLVVERERINFDK